ncbi:MAG: TolB-like translocation protein [Planctomycetota bacterium]
MIVGRIAGAALLAVLASGCVAREVGRTPGRFITPERTELEESLDPNDVSAEVAWRRIGEVDYDDFSIPLSSPDGRFLAVRSGAPPAWPTVLARTDARPSSVVPIEILRIEPDEVVRVRTVRGPWLLGRGADANGFLVEEQRPDGTRRIGRVPWTDGSPTWLVDDEFVNAFATNGPDGTLAWSRRRVEDSSFDLMVRRPDTPDWRLERRFERSWIDPVLADDGRTIFALRRGDGTVELGWSRLTDEARFRDGMITHPISIRTNERLVHAMLSPQAGIEASPPGGPPRIIFLHPDLQRLVEWSPERDLARPFPEGVIVASMLDENRGIAATDDGLLFVELAASGGLLPTRIRLAERLAIPRRSGIESDPILLLRPGSGRFELLLARLRDTG